MKVFSTLICGALLSLSALSLSPSALAQTEKTPLKAPVWTGPGAIQKIEWGKPQWITQGTYGRMLRLKNSAILCCYEAGGKSYVKRSDDNGASWSDPILVRELENAGAANPELVQLADERIALFYNQRPAKDSPQSVKHAIGVVWSDDDGTSWTPQEKPIFEAAHDGQDGCWEPAAIALPNGELQLFFANEFPYQTNGDQNISLMKSKDGGKTWSAPQAIIYRAGHRDGMPVPLLLGDGETLVVSFEDNGLAPGNALQPAIARTKIEDAWKTLIDGASEDRAGAIEPKLADGVYVGAPYICKLAWGETLLSGQSLEGNREKPQMVVYIGDRNAQKFGQKSIPIELPGNVAANWNSLFAKDENTVVAVTSTVIDGKSGLWAIEGKVVRAPWVTG